MTQATATATEQATDKTAIRPFQFNFPDAELTDLRRRVNATRWPERELVTDVSQGVQLATIQRLARYWGTDYDCRKGEAKLKAVPHFITQIDGLDIHRAHSWNRRTRPRGSLRGTAPALAPTRIHWPSANSSMKPPRILWKASPLNRPSVSRG